MELTKIAFTPFHCFGLKFGWSGGDNSHPISLPRAQRVHSILSRVDDATGSWVWQSAFCWWVFPS